MPSPIAHSATGYVIAKLLPRRWVRNLPGQGSLQAMLFAIAVANLADFDFLLQAIGIGQHRGITHTLLFLLCFSLAVGGITLWQRRVPAAIATVYTLLLYGSHLMLDFFTAGGPGMRLLAPFSSMFFKAGSPLFPPVHHSRGLLYGGHWEFITFELMYSGFLLGLLWLGKRPMQQIASRIGSYLCRWRLNKL
jgi:inner membrane protein